jgi:outer membrane protein OmpA-like peptidoglycan-associated protein
MKWLILLFLFPSLSAWPDDLHFQYLDGDQFGYDGQSQQSVTANGKKIQDNTDTFHSRYSISKEEDRDPEVTVETTFDSESKGAHSAAEDTESKKVAYSIDSKGLYHVPEGALLPVVRDIPRFPARAIGEGDTWSQAGSEIIDLSGIAVFSQNNKTLPVFLVTFPVSYHDLGSEDRQGKPLEKIELEYVIAYRPVLSEGYRVYPQIISGKTHQILYFDNALGVVEEYTEDYVLDLVLSNGDLFEFSGKTLATLRIDSLKDRPVPVVETPPAEPQPTPSVSDSTAASASPTASVPEKPHFEPILFAANSSALQPEEIAKLNNIAEVLKGIEGDVLIEGFTADAGTERQRKTLSEARAAVIADVLVKLGVRTADQILTSDLGSRKPSAPNDTAEHRAENRRALVVLLDD